jgi:hypothetical protein
MAEDGELVLSCGGVNLVITPRMLTALGDCIAAQIAVDEAMDELPEPRPMLRLVGQDGSVTHPIACEFRMAAMIDGRPPPACTWGVLSSSSTFDCKLCGLEVGPADERHAALAGFFGTDGLSERERKVIAAVLRALAGKPHAADLERFAAGLLALEPAAVAFVRAAVGEVDRG